MRRKDVIRGLKVLFIIVYTIILLYFIYRAYQTWQTPLIGIYLALIALWTTGVWALSRIIDWLFHENQKIEGKLHVSDIILQPNETEGTCTLDFRVHNNGSSDVQINRVNFKVLDVKEIGILASQSFSEVYGLDISELKEIGDISKDSILHQNIEPAKSDRFAIVLTAKKITGYRLWKLEPKLITNFGEVLGQPVEIWLPYILKQLSQSSKEQMDRELEEMERELKSSK